MNNLIATLTKVLNGELVYALGWTILHSLWQCTLIAALLAIGLQCGKKLSSNSRYLLAYTALLLCFFISLITFQSYWEQAKAARLALTLDALGIKLPAVVNVQSQFQQWLAGADHYLVWIVVSWLTGCAFMSLRGLADYYRSLHLKDNADKAIPAHWQQTLAKLQTQVQVVQQVSLRISNRITSPCTLGHFKPVILLPAGLLTGISQAHVEVILLHELAHIRRRDYAFGLFQMLINILFFFNPMTLWISSAINTERENACDDIAVDICQSPRLFSQALQEVVAIAHRKNATANKLATPMSIIGKKMSLLNRIKRQFNQRRPLSQALEKSIAASLLIISSATACVYAQTNSPEANSEATLIAPFKRLPAFASLSDAEQLAIAKHFLEEYDQKVFNTGVLNETQLQDVNGAQIVVRSFEDPMKRMITINTTMLRKLRDSPQLNLQQDKVTLFKDSQGNSVIAIEKLAPSQMPPSLADAYKTASLNNKFFARTIEPHNWKEEPADLTFKVSYQYLFIILSSRLVEFTIAGAPDDSTNSNNIFEDYRKKSLVRGAPYAGGERSDGGSLVITYDRTAWEEKMNWMRENQLFDSSPAKEVKIPSPNQRNQELAGLMYKLDERRKRLVMSDSQYQTLFTCFHRHFGFAAPDLFKFNMQSGMLSHLLALDDEQLATMEKDQQARLRQFKMGPNGDEFYIDLLDPDFTTCDRKVH